MKAKNLVSLNEFCTKKNTGISVNHSNNQPGLIEISTAKETGFINEVQLKHLEKYIRCYDEQDFNLNGIETITHLLQRINCVSSW